MLIKKPNTINGPNGMGSFFPFIFVINKKTEIIAPSIKDKNIIRNIRLMPVINPKAAIKVTSPPPIPPLDTKIIIINNSPLKTSPPILFNSSRGLLYNKNDRTL